MNQSTAEVINYPQENEFKVVEFELTPKAIEKMVKEYETLKLIPGDKESYQAIHQAKMICVKARTGTDKRRKELGSDAREWIKEVNNKAQELIAPLLPLEEKLKGMLEEEDQREAKIEQARVEKINELIANLDVLSTAGLQYNRTADEIAEDLGKLETFETSAVDFQEKTEAAEQIKADGIQNTKRALKNRIEWEETQAEQARIAKENEAKEKALAEEREKFEAEQEAERKKQAEIQKRLDDERQAKEMEAQKIADQQAEKLRIEQEKLEADRKALEDQKAEIKAREEAEKLKKYLSDWDDAIEVNRVFIPDSAVTMNSYFDLAKAEDEAARKEQLKKDKARAKLIASDKDMIHGVIAAFDQYLSMFVAEYNTSEAAQIEIDLITKVKTALDEAEKAGVELV